ncbi:MAG TPA: hypothetical protein VG944_13650, partial [Fimbriimonas sp.]|nr:hypothetical protein [Fimbriimonas sp.]
VNYKSCNKDFSVLAPIFEKHGIAIVFSGHEHLYQRTQPIRFAPGDLKGAQLVNKGNRFVPGEFKVDRAFDGVASRSADGVIYLTTGAGGKHLYDPEMNENPKNWMHKEDGNVEYVARLISDQTPRGPRRSNPGFSVPAFPTQKARYPSRTSDPRKLSDSQSRNRRIHLL